MLRAARRYARRVRYPWHLVSQYSCRRTFHLDIPLVNDLNDRGLITDTTVAQKQLHEALGHQSLGVYAGFDPTASSLHAGHLLPLLCLLHFRLRGHRIYPLLGGATGFVGDPSGRLEERELQNKERIEHNVASLESHIKLFFARAQNYAERRAVSTRSRFHEVTILNNYHWHQDMKLLQFLQTVGRHVKVNTMLSRQSVQSRMKGAEGINFAEFSYQLLQAYDFYWLYTKNGSGLDVSIQIGGSDQWGNIIAGLDLINKAEDSDTSKSPHRKGLGILTPLLTTASGEKFGKSAGNAVWLDDAQTSVLDFYQFFLKTADADVDRYLKMFTLVKLSDITETMERHNREPHLRIAQRLLADEVTELVHTEQGLNHAHTATKVLFETDYSNLQAKDIIEALSKDPRLTFCEEAELLETPIGSLASAFKLVPSKSAARTLIASNGLSVNNRRVQDVHFKLTRSDLVDGRIAIMRAGKDKHVVLSLK